MNFVVGSIQTTHYQHTAGEYAYVFMRTYNAVANVNYMILDDSKNSFSIWIPPRKMNLDISNSGPVPVRINVNHDLGMSTMDMGPVALPYVVSIVLEGAVNEVALRAPHRVDCFCSDSHVHLPSCATGEFSISGFIAAG